MTSLPSPRPLVSARPPRGLTASALGVGVLTALLRLAAFNGFENDHFMHLSWAQQMLLGAWPGRDFVEPGMPLAVVLSAVGQWLWPGFFSEALLGTACVGLAAGFTCAAVGRITRSAVAGLTAGLIVLAAYPRLYSFPKLLVPALAVWSLLHYVDRRTALRLSWLALWTTLAFLLRHDLGLMTAAAVVAGLVADSVAPGRSKLGAVVRYLAIGLVGVAPYVGYVQWAEGLDEHVRVAAEFARSDEHQLLWPGPSLWAGADERVLAAGLSAEAVLFWVFALAALALTALALRRSTPDGLDVVRPALAAAAVFACIYAAVIVRYPLRARLPDGAVIGAIAAVVVVHRVWTILRTRQGSVLPKFIGLTAVGGLTLVAALSVWTVANVGDRIAQAGLDRGPSGVVISLRDVLRRAPERSWRPYWPGDDVPPVIDYLARCTTPRERLLVTWFAPEYAVFAGRGFAAGHAYFLTTSFATRRDQIAMIERLGRESVPVALINEREQEPFARAFPLLARHVAEHYTVRARFLHSGDTPIGVAFFNGWALPGLTTAEWTCRS